MTAHRTRSRLFPCFLTVDSVPPRRRAIQHRIIDGPAAAQIIAGDESAADRQLAGLIAADRARATGQMNAGQMNAGQFKIIDMGSGDVGLLSFRGVEAIRNADLVVHQTGTDAAIIDLARREADFAALPDSLSGRAMGGPVKKVADMVVDALLGGQFVVLLLPPSFRPPFRLTIMAPNDLAPNDLALIDPALGP